MRPLLFRLKPKYADDKKTKQRKIVMKKTVLFFFCCLLMFSSLVWADKVYLTNGNKIEGKITSENDSFVVLDVGGGSIKIYRREIQNLEREEIPAAAVAAVKPAIETVSPVPAVNAQKIKKESAKKPTFFDSIMSRVQNFAKPETKAKVKQPSGRKTRLLELTNMSMMDWGKIIAEQAFGAGILKKYTKEYLTRLVFVLFFVFLFWAFIIKFFVKLLGSQSTFFDAFMFQIKTFLTGLVLVLLLKGAIPAILLMLFQKLNAHIATIDKTAYILSVSATILTFFHFSKKDLDLSIIRSIGLFLMSGVAAFVLRWAITTYVFKF